MHLAEKRIARDIPPRLGSCSRFYFFGHGADAWVEPMRLLLEDGFRSSRLMWPSESALLGFPLGGLDTAEGGPHAARISTYHPKPVDIAALASALASHPPQVLLFDIHPQWVPSEEIATSLERTHAGWRWATNSALLGEPQSREGPIHVFAASVIPRNRQFPPLYILDVYLPQFINDCLSEEDHYPFFSEGDLHINYHNSTSLLEPTPLGYIKLHRSKIPPGAKVRARNGKTGVAAGPSGAGWSVFVQEQLSNFCEKDVSVIATNYPVFSVHGVSFPVGGRFFPSGYSHTLIYDPYYSRARPLTLVEDWSLQGGTLKTIFKHTEEYRELSLLTSTPVAKKIIWPVWL